MAQRTATNTRNQFHSRNQTINSHLRNLRTAVCRRHSVHPVDRVAFDWVPILKHTTYERTLRNHFITPCVRTTSRRPFSGPVQGESNCSQSPATASTLGHTGEAELTVLNHGRRHLVYVSYSAFEGHLRNKMAAQRHLSSMSRPLPRPAGCVFGATAATKQS